LLRSARLLRQHIERALAVHDLDLNQYLVISMLGIDAMEPTMPSELGLTIDATRTQMTRLIDGLETRGLVQRKASQHDRRSLELILTPAAHDLLKRTDSPCRLRRSLGTHRQDRSGSRHARSRSATSASGRVGSKRIVTAQADPGIGCAPA
jgi:DNA-binding MarR family transcriptional regulator